MKADVNSTLPPIAVKTPSTAVGPLSWNAENDGDRHSTFNSSSNARRVYLSESVGPLPNSAAFDSPSPGADCESDQTANGQKKRMVPLIKRPDSPEASFSPSSMAVMATPSKSISLNSALGVTNTRRRRVSIDTGTVFREENETSDVQLGRESGNRDLSPQSRGGDRLGNRTEVAKSADGGQRWAQRVDVGIQEKIRQDKRNALSKLDDLNSTNGMSLRNAAERAYSQQQSGTDASTLSPPDAVEDARQLNSPTSASARNAAAASTSLSSTPTAASRGAWDMFEEHLRMIHDSSDVMSRRNNLTFSSSSTFQETMVDLFGHSNYAKPLPPPTAPAGSRSRAFSRTAEKLLNAQMRVRKSSVFVKNDEVRMSGLEDVCQTSVDNARRGWRLLKQHVQEMTASKRTSQAALNWGMLRQTLKGMTDLNQTRWDLYQRYGVVPTRGSDGKLVKENTMLSERARKAIAAGSRHPLLAHSNSVCSSQPQQFDRASSSLTSSSLGKPTGVRRRIRSTPWKMQLASDSGDGNNAVGGSRLRSSVQRKNSDQS